MFYSILRLCVLHGCLINKGSVANFRRIGLKNAIAYLPLKILLEKKEPWADGSSSWVSIGACEQTDQPC